MYKKTSPQKRLSQLLKLDKQDIITIIIYSILVGCLMLIVPIASQALINIVAFGTLLQPILILSFLVLVFLGFAETLQAIKTYAVEIIQRRLFLRISTGISQSITESKFENFDKIRGQELANRFFEVTTVQKIASVMLLDSLSIILQIFIGLLLLAIYHPLLLAFDIFLVCSILFIFFILGKGGSKTSIEESKAKYKMAEWLEEIGKHNILFQSKNGKDFAMKMSDSFSELYLKKRKNHFRILFRQYIGTFALHAIASSLLLGIGGWLVVKGQLSLGQLVAAELVVNSIVDNLTKFGKYFENYYDVIASMDKLGDIFDLPKKIFKHTNLGSCEGGIAIEVKNLEYHKNHHIIFDKINFKVKENEMILITGSQGAGKSLLSQILAGLRQPTSGEVLYNNIDIQSVDDINLLKNCYLLKFTDLLPCTLFNNIALGHENISYQQVKSVLEKLDAWNEIQKYPEKLDTPVHSSQNSFSDSFVAKILLARAIIHDAKLILVDRLFDIFDKETRNHLIDFLKTLKSKPTIIIFSAHNQLGGIQAKYKIERGHLLEGDVDQ